MAVRSWSAASTSNRVAGTWANKANSWRKVPTGPVMAQRLKESRLIKTLSAESAAPAEEFAGVEKSWDSGAFNKLSMEFVKRGGNLGASSGGIRDKLRGFS